MIFLQQLLIWSKYRRDGSGVNTNTMAMLQMGVKVVAIVVLA
jgi:hypothetical protein